MEHQIPVPSKIRKRATKACLACRARKVRCDVSQRGRPCMNCYLDGESCVVIGRASRRRKSKDDGSNDNGAAAEDAGSSHLQRGRGSVEPDLGLEQSADGDVLMDTPSDGGSERPEIFKDLDHRGFSAVSSAPNGTKGAGFQGRETAHYSVASQYAPRSVSYEYRHHHHHQQQQHSPSTAKLQQLQWAGEQSTTFGSDVTYTYFPFLTLDNISNMLPQDVSYLEMQGCFRVPIRTILDEFVKQYFLHVHPIMALLNESDVWELYGSSSENVPGSQKMSLMIWQAMLFSACNYISRSTLRTLGFVDTKTARAAFYRRAKLLFDFEAESSHVATAQAALLLASWNPYPGRGRGCPGSSWLGIAIEQARFAGAHRAAWLAETSAPGQQKHKLALKKLWWCIILHDRVSALCSRKASKVTRAHCDFDREERPFGPEILAYEKNGSRVYNIETKTSLLGSVFPEILRLAVVLTDLLAVAQEQDELAQWNKHHEQESINKCKLNMRNWYRVASTKCKPPGSRVARQSNDQRQEEFRHDSVVLYTDLAYLIYYAAMTKLCHFECFQLLQHGRWMGPDGASALEKTIMSENHSDLRDAAFGVVACLKDLAQHRLLRWVPPNLIGCLSLPLILSIIDVRLSYGPHPGLPDLRQLDELARGYQPHQDMTDWTSDAIREILDLVQLEGNTQYHHHQQHPGTEGGAHPSMCLRLALSMDPSGRSPTSTHDLVASLPRLLATDRLRRARAALSRQESDPGGLRRSASTSASARAQHGPSARSAAATLTALAAHPDDDIQLRMAEWMRQDQAISYGVQLGLVPSDMPGEEQGRRGEGGAGADEMGQGHQERTSSTAVHRQDDHTQADVDLEQDSMARAFSETGELLEEKMLDAFAFWDEAPGARGPELPDIPEVTNGVAQFGSRVMPAGSAVDDSGEGEMGRGPWSNLGT